MRIGLVGYGHGGRFFHAPLIATLPGATFVGVVTRSPERRQQLANDHPGLKAFDSIGQIVEAGVDALVISTTLKAVRPWYWKPSNTASRWSATNRSPPTRNRPRR
jgi:predicted dehydrogenase